MRSWIWITTSNIVRKWTKISFFATQKKKIVLDLRRTRSSENLLHNAESTDLGQSLFEMGKPSLDQDSMTAGGTEMDSIANEMKKEQLAHQQTQEEMAPALPKGINVLNLLFTFGFFKLILKKY